MILEELKKLMPDADEATLNTSLVAINADAKKMIEAETKGLVDNKTKLLSQMTKLKENQSPEGFDAESYADYTKNKDELASKQKELDDAKLAGEGQWEALKIKLNETNATALTALTTEKDTEISTLTNALDKVLIDNASLKAIEAEKGNSLFLLPHMKGQIKTFINEKNEFDVQVVNADGTPRLKDDATTAFGVNDLVAEFKANDSFASAFPELNAGGGGNANAGGKGGSGINPWKKETKNITQQAAMIRDNPTLAAQMKKSAGVQ